MNYYNKNYFLTIIITLIFSIKSFSQIDLRPQDFDSLGVFNPTENVFANTDELSLWSGNNNYTGIQYEDYVVFTFDDVNLNAGLSINVSGTDGIAILSNNDLVFNGTLNSLVPYHFVSDDKLEFVDESILDYKGRTSNGSFASVWTDNISLGINNSLLFISFDDIKPNDISDFNLINKEANFIQQSIPEPATYQLLLIALVIVVVINLNVRKTK